MPPRDAAFGTIPSFTPIKNITFISLRRVRSISPMVTVSYPGGITATSAASSPASSISTNSSVFICSSPRSAIYFSKSCITILYICPYSFDLVCMPASRNSCSFAASFPPTSSFAVSSYIDMQKSRTVLLLS